MYCINHTAYIAKKVNTRFPLTIHSRKSGALCLGNGVNSIRNKKRNETQGVSSGLAVLFWDEGYCVKRLNE